MHPAVLMQVAHRHAEVRVLERIASRGHAMTTAQARLAARVDEGGTRLTELAERAGITKQSAGFLVDALEREGYVRRVPDPSDARARLVRLAARGEEVREVAREVERELLREWEERLGRERFTVLREALAELREITDA